MKRITSIAACLLMGIAFVASASAQDHAAKATVPFNFSVGDTWLPAGTYSITSDSRSPNVIVIRNGDKNISLISVAFADDPQSGPGKLVFKKYGDHYFLHQLLCSSCRMNVAFSGSKREKLARTREASIPTTTDVLLAAK